MTRPMPGPPGGFTDRARLNYALLGEQITYEQYQEFDNALTRSFTARPKRLTDAECAAEFWSAMCSAQFIEWAPNEELGIEIPADGQLYQVTRPDPEPAYDIAETWHRFATRPHALEATP